MILRDKSGKTGKVQHTVACFFLAILISIFAITPTTAIDLTNVSGKNTTIGTDERYWIVIDPVRDASVGDSIVIQGTTNVPEGNNLTIGIFGSNCFHSQMYIYSCRYFEQVNTTVKKESSNLTGFFSTNVNTSGHEPDVYDVSITFGSGNDLRGQNITQWNLTDNLSPQITSNQTINSGIPSDVNSGIQLTKTPASSLSLLLFPIAGFIFIFLQTKKRTK